MYKALSKINRRRLDCVLDRDNRKSIFCSIAGDDMEYIHDDLFRDLNTYYNLISGAGEQTEREVGCYLGMVIGDALGAPIEFLPVNDDPTLVSVCITSYGEVSYPYETSNVFNLQFGQWTDDASMGACIADSLLVHAPFEVETLDSSAWSTAFCARDIRSRFWNWTSNGYNNAFVHCRTHDPYRSVGLGGNIGKSLRDLNGQHFEDIADYYLSSSQDSGIGGLMRLAPVPVFFSEAPIDVAMKYAGLSSQITHPGDIATCAAEFQAYFIHRAMHRNGDMASSAAKFANATAEEYIEMLQRKQHLSKAETLLLRLLQGNEPPTSTELSWNWRQSTLHLHSTMINRGVMYNGYPNNPNYYGSYCLDGLAVALHAFHNTDSFVACLVKCINYRGDADSTAAVAGQLAGAFYGLSAIPTQLLQPIMRWDDGEHLLRALMVTPWFRHQQRSYCEEGDRLPITYQHDDPRHVSHTKCYPVYPEESLVQEELSNASMNRVSSSIFQRALSWIYKFSA